MDIVDLFLLIIAVGILLVGKWAERIKSRRNLEKEERECLGLPPEDIG